MNATIPPLPTTAARPWDALDRPTPLQAPTTAAEAVAQARAIVTMAATAVADVLHGEAGPAADAQVQGHRAGAVTAETIRAVLAGERSPDALVVAHRHLLRMATRLDVWQPAPHERVTARYLDVLADACWVCAAPYQGRSLAEQVALRRADTLHRRLAQLAETTGRQLDQLPEYDPATVAEWCAEAQAAGLTLGRPLPHVAAAQKWRKAPYNAVYVSLEWVDPRAARIVLAPYLSEQRLGDVVVAAEVVITTKGVTVTAGGSAHAAVPCDPWLPERGHAVLLALGATTQDPRTILTAAVGDPKCLGLYVSGYGEVVTVAPSRTAKTSVVVTAPGDVEHRVTVPTLKAAL